MSVNSALSLRVSWFDPEAKLLRLFIMKFCPEDNSLEMYDVKNCRTFLKRIKCDHFSSQDLYIGNTVNILNRQVKIEDYMDDVTKAALCPLFERSMIIIGSSATQLVGQVLSIVIEYGLKISLLKMISVPRWLLDAIGDDLTDPELSNILQKATEKPIIIIETVGENALRCVGAAASRFFSPQIHADEMDESDLAKEIFYSKSIEEAENVRKYLCTISLPLWYSPHQHSTCCIIKPHAVTSGEHGQIITDIINEGYMITSMYMVHLRVSEAEQFLEVYRGVVPEFMGMMHELCSGSCIIMAVSSSCNNINTAAAFRQLVGPSDPDIARQIRPHTLRARYGFTTIQNAVHCTDLPEDASLELDFFFTGCLCEKLV